LWFTELLFDYEVACIQLKNYQKQKDLIGKLHKIPACMIRYVFAVSLY